MPSRSKLSLLIFIACLTAVSVGYWRGVPGVPFHPDESSYLFMSNEIKPLLQHPSDFFWSTAPADWKRQTMRLLDPPLVHWVVELGRRAVNRPPLPEDWNWQRTWADNQRAGVLPQPDLLNAARMAVAVFFPFSILFFFLAVRRAAGDITAWLAALLMVTNALVLLHTRRAMAEGLLIFTLSAALWVLMRAEKRPWWGAVPAALAFCAKQSLVVLGPLGLAAVIWQPGLAWPARLRQAALFGALYAGIILLLSPFMWQQPIQAGLAALHLRQDLVNLQASHYAAQVVDTPPQRLAALVRQVYFAPPSFAEDPQYQPHTLASEQAYLANPLNQLLRSPAAGWTLLIAGLGGIGAAFWQARRRGGLVRRRLGLLLGATAAQVIFLLIAVPLEWQRYYLPLVPFACLWAAYGLTQAAGWLLAFTRPRKNHRPSSGDGLR